MLCFGIENYFKHSDLNVHELKLIEAERQLQKIDWVMSLVNLNTVFSFYS